MKTRYRRRTFLLELLMIAVAIMFLFPVYVLITLSLKSPAEINAGGLGLPREWDVANYSDAWSGATLGPAFLNSILITTGSLVGLILLGSFAAYYLARTMTRLSYGLFILFITGIVLPFQLAMVPLYDMVSKAGLIGTKVSIIAFYIGLQLPFTIFLYSGFLRALPRDYGEAALIDGASHLQCFARIVFPLMRPITGTVVILNTVFVWNDFLTPLLYLGGSPNETVPVVIYRFVGQYQSEWGLLFAAVVLASVPVLVVFVLLQRYVIKGFASGLKG